MAEKKDTLFKMTEDAKQHIVSLKSELDKAERNIPILEEGGIDATALKAKIKQNRKLIDLIEKEYK